MIKDLINVHFISADIKGLDNQKKISDMGFNVDWYRKMIEKIH